MSNKLTPEQKPAWAECDCLSKYGTLLREKGFTLSRKLSALMMKGNTLSHQWVLPLERVDGKKLRASDPSTLTACFCPMCGNALEDPALKGARHE